MLKSDIKQPCGRQKQAYLRLRKRLHSYHKMRPHRLQPASSYPSPFDPTLEQILELANLVKQTFDGSGARAREALYVLLRYPSASICFDDTEVRSIRTAAELQPPARWEKHLNEYCCQKGGNRNPFIDRPSLVTDFDPSKL